MSHEWAYLTRLVIILLIQKLLLCHFETVQEKMCILVLFNCFHFSDKNVDANLKNYVL